MGAYHNTLPRDFYHRKTHMGWLERGGKKSRRRKRLQDWISESGAEVPLQSNATPEAEKWT